jgi:hypothetical protein
MDKDRRIFVDPLQTKILNPMPENERLQRLVNDAGKCAVLFFQVLSFIAREVSDNPELRRAEAERHRELLGGDFSIRFCSVVKETATRLGGSLGILLESYEHIIRFIEGAGPEAFPPWRVIEVEGYIAYQIMRQAHSFILDDLKRIKPEWALWEERLQEFREHSEEGWVKIVRHVAEAIENAMEPQTQEQLAPRFGNDTNVIKRPCARAVDFGLLVKYKTPPGYFLPYLPARPEWKLVRTKRPRSDA